AESPEKDARRAVEGQRGFAPARSRDLELQELQLANAIERHRQGRDRSPRCSARRRPEPESEC
ncbi:MAG: hypothetical protein AB1758_26235, partial [Candidatus Eremiobacterota bacterium]